MQEPHSHNPEAIRERLSQKPKASYLREWVYGGIDGTVTTFAVVAGVTGANLSPAIVVILGIANLIGDGFSMAAGAYSGAKTEADNYERLQTQEKRQIEHNPEGEREEIRQIYAAKGFSGEILEEITSAITADRQAWITTMMEGEYGLTPNPAKPVKIGLNTFLAFVFCGAMPLIPFILSMPKAFEAALFLSALTFFGIGSFKSRWSVHSWWRQGFETFLIGMSAAGIAFVIGYWLRGIGL